MQHLFGLAFLGALALGAAATVYFEVRGLAGWLSWMLLKLAVRLVPPGARHDEVDEEWRATWKTWEDGALGRLVWAVTLLPAGGIIGYRVQREAKVLNARNSADAEGVGPAPAEPVPPLGTEEAVQPKISGSWVGAWSEENEILLSPPKEF